MSECKQRKPSEFFDTSDFEFETSEYFSVTESSIRYNEDTLFDGLLYDYSRAYVQKFKRIRFILKYFNSKFLESACQRILEIEKKDFVAYSYCWSRFTPYIASNYERGGYE